MLTENVERREERGKRKEERGKKIPEGTVPLFGS
jgi:hypothetical protein